MTRKTKVRISGEPGLADQILEFLVAHVELADDVQRFDQPVGPGTNLGSGPAVTYYVSVKKMKEPRK